MTSEEQDVVDCPYCGKVFTDENSKFDDAEISKGVHVSQEHVNNDKIVRKNDGRHNRTNIVDEEWKNTSKNKNSAGSA